MRGNGQNHSLTSVDKHMTSILKTGQWKKQLENNDRPFSCEKGVVFSHNDLNFTLNSDHKSIMYKIKKTFQTQPTLSTLLLALQH